MKLSATQYQKLIERAEGLLEYARAVEQEIRTQAVVADLSRAKKLMSHLRTAAACLAKELEDSQPSQV